MLIRRRPLSGMTPSPFVLRPPPPPRLPLKPRREKPRAAAKSESRGQGPHDHPAGGRHFRPLAYILRRSSLQKTLSVVLDRTRRRCSSWRGRDYREGEKSSSRGKVGRARGDFSTADVKGCLLLFLLPFFF